jgi:cobalamin biosynthesis Mg chelatase CobN
MAGMAGVFVAGFALAGGSGAALDDTTTTGITLTDITSVTTNLTTNLTTSLPTSVLTDTQAVKPKPPPRKQRRKRRVTTTSTAATTAPPPATTTSPARTTGRARPRRATTVAAAATGSSGLPAWAFGGFAVAAVLIAAGLGGLYVTRIRKP